MKLAAQLLAVALFCVAPATAVLAQQTFRPRPYDGIQAGLDAYRLAEERRRSDVQEQLNLNDDLRAWSGLPPSTGEAFFYRGALRPTYANLDAIYGYGYGLGFSSPYANWRIGYRSWPYSPQPLAVFEPWPYVAGDIWGYPYTTPWRQPVGRWEGQTGPNRWESHPIYDPPITPYRASPPVESPLLDGTPYASPATSRPGAARTDDGRTDSALPPPPPTPAADLPDVTPRPPANSADSFDAQRSDRAPPAAKKPRPQPRPGVREF